MINKYIFFTWLLMLLLPVITFAQQKTMKLYEDDKHEWIENLTETASGLKYDIKKKGNGKQPLAGDIVSVHYIGILENDSIFDNSYERGEPLIFNYGVGQVIKGWDQILGMLQEGGEAVLVVPPELGYGNREIQGIPQNSTLFFKIELVNVERNKSFEPFKVAGKDTIQTNSGLKYVIIDSGSGQKPDTSSWAYLHFKGYLPDGEIFDASALRGEPVRINPGANEIIPAWDEIVQLMRPGARFHVIVPPELAYADEGLDGVVPPATTLRFDLELLHVSEKREIKPFDVDGKDTVKLDSGLQYISVKSGVGDRPEEGEVVKIHFTGYFKNGEMFQSSLKTDDEVIFAIGQKQVIKGLDEVVKHMRPEGKIRAIIPWQLAYGKEGYKPVIPPKEDLIFDIELISVVR